MGALFGDALSRSTGATSGRSCCSAAIIVSVGTGGVGIGLEKLTVRYDDARRRRGAIPAAVTFLVVAPLITATCIHALRAIAAGGRPRRWRTLSGGFDAFSPIFFAVLLAAVGIALGLLLLIVPGRLPVRPLVLRPAGGGDRGRPRRRGAAASGRVVEGFWWRTFGLIVLVNLAATVPNLLRSRPSPRSADGRATAPSGALAGQIAGQR